MYAPIAFNQQTRVQDLQRLNNTLFDVVIIGGGINGCATARELALRGLSVALLEAQDFGAGASGGSSKLLHGGLRYTENLRNWPLVLEAQREKQIQQRLAPHLCRSLSFLLPIWSDGGLKSWQGWAAMLVYQLLAIGSGQPQFKHLSSSDTLRVLPNIKAVQLREAFAYIDAQMLDDHRLVLENLLDARAHGAVTVSYCRVQHFEKDSAGKITGLRAIDTLGQNQELSIQGRCFINAAGPWCDEVSHLVGNQPVPRIKPSRGIHLVLKNLTLKDAVVIFDGDQHRVVFALPWLHGHSVLGTTDVFPESHLDPYPSAAEVNYLKAIIAKYFPHQAPTVTGTFYGLRPLLLQKKGRPGQLSRKHRISVHHKSGLISILGGKFTTYRAMAEEAATKALKRLQQSELIHRVSTRTWPLYSTAPQGVSSLSIDIAQQLTTLLEQRWDAAKIKIQTQHLLRYGKYALNIIQLMRDNIGCATPMFDDFPYTFSELAYLVKHEQVLTLNDLLFRRTRLGEFIGLNQAEHLETVVRMLKTLLQKSEDWALEQIHLYQVEVSKRMPAL